jgi:glycosyltransferase involved in cell wall biosynthesis
MKTAIVHDYLAQAGGAERVAATLHGLFPEAPLFTSVYDAKATLPYFRGIDVRTSILQRWPLCSQRMHKFALPLYPTAFEHFDFHGFDLVLSSSSSFAKGVITPPETCHICYCHTPARFAWRQREYLSQSRRGRLMSLLLRGMLGRLRAWDVESASRPDYYVANSYHVAQRIRKYYRRDVAAVIPPPIETERYAPVSPREVGSHFLVVSRLVGYKRIDLAVEACNRLQVPLKVVGSGPDLVGLKRIAGPTIQFLGRLSDSQVAQEFARCRALIFPGEEDFGMTPLECMASGRPVVAFGAGGALETVTDGETGVLFSSQTVDSLAAALVSLNHMEFAPSHLQAHAARFGRSVFQDRMTQFIEGAVAQHQSRLRTHYGIGSCRPEASYSPVGDEEWFNPFSLPGK